MRFFRSFSIIAFLTLCASAPLREIRCAEPPANFQKENLVAWCIVPFDAKQRGPAERAQLVSDLGLKRVAYDWRKEHVAEFEEEILAYKKHGIEYFAFWNEHEDAFALFEKHDLHPQIWKTNPSPKTGTPEEKIAAAADQLLPLAKRARQLGSKFGLYNHGGWGGEPENLVAVCKRLNSLLRAAVSVEASAKTEGASSARPASDSSVTPVGIVYNFHHGHGHIDRFAEALELMKPHLLCLNLNGMAAAADVDSKSKKNKILPVGTGKHEKAMIQSVLASGYTGPIGILGHIKEQDVEKSLRDNLEGLETILAGTR